MSPVERMILRHKAARYAFVLISLPIVAVRDELARLRYYRPETGMDDLRRALTWARVGGVPGQPQPRSEPAPVHPKWQPEPADASPFAEIVDPCCGCGCAKADHRDGRCIGDFFHCPCETWMPLDDQATATGSNPSGGGR